VSAYPAIDLISDFDCDYVLADKAYDSNDILKTIASLQAIAVIPPKKNRTVQRNYDKHIYKERHLVEIFFNRIKNYRRIATRYEKTARNYMAMLLISCCLLWAGI